MNNGKGILLLATTHPYYGRMAYNLCVSIKATGTTIPVCVLHQGRGLSHLSDAQKSVFDKVIEIEQQAFEAKLYLYDHSPFEQTIFIDADTAWLYKKTPEQLFATCEGLDFQAIVETTDPRYMLWADEQQMREKYKITGELNKLRSEVMFFRKGEAAKEIFLLAQTIHDDPLVDVTMFAGQIPDEFCLNIACAILQVKMNAEWSPSFWFNINRKFFPLPELASRYFVISTGGNTVNHRVKKIYNSMMAGAFYKMRLQYVFTLQSKKEVLSERQTI